VPLLLLSKKSSSCRPPTVRGSRCRVEFCHSFFCSFFCLTTLFPICFLMLLTRQAKEPKTSHPSRALRNTHPDFPVLGKRLQQSKPQKARRLQDAMQAGIGQSATVQIFLPPALRCLSLPRQFPEASPPPEPPPAALPLKFAKDSPSGTSAGKRQGGERHITAGRRSAGSNALVCPGSALQRFQPPFHAALRRRRCSRRPSAAAAPAA